MTLSWSPDWREQVEPGEAASWDRFADDLAALAREVSSRTGRPVGRVFHVKQHIGVRGTLRVLSGLPHPLSSGVFAAEREWPCYVRFSNGAVRSQVDRILDVRGLALKLVGVEGPKLLGGDDVTQDFLFVQTPAVPTDSPAEFLALARASVAGPIWLPAKLATSVGIVRAARILFRLAQIEQPASYFAARLFSAVPIQLGPAAMKLDLLPADLHAVRRGGTLRDDLIARLRGGPLRYRVRAQLFTDELRTPIESASRAWPERVAAFHDVGVLEIPAQDVQSPTGHALDETIGRMGFDPWHGLDAHRPLGATQRGRRAAYARSRAQRAALPEPRT